jgi:hypothetical protein
VPEWLLWLFESTVVVIVGLTVLVLAQRRRLRKAGQPGAGPGGAGPGGPGPGGGGPVDWHLPARQAAVRDGTARR